MMSDLPHRLKKDGVEFKTAPGPNNNNNNNNNNKRQRIKDNISENKEKKRKLWNKGTKKRRNNRRSDRVGSFPLIFAA